MVQKRERGEPRIIQKTRGSDVRSTGRTGWPSGFFDSHKTEDVLRTAVGR